jgi:hypothetical protein
VVVDGVTRNSELHPLLADVLLPLGIPGTGNPPAFAEFLRGRVDDPGTRSVTGSWNLYQYTAAGFDLSQPWQAPRSTWVWGEGAPRDVPELDGVPTLLIGPPSYQRDWNPDRIFWALGADVTVVEEFHADRVRSLLARAKQASSGLTP